MYAKHRGRPAKFIAVGNELRNYIRSSQLADGSPLPSERKMAKLFDCTQVTIRRALKYLEDEKGITVEVPEGLGNIHTYIFIVVERSILGKIIALRCFNTKFLN